MFKVVIEHLEPCVSPWLLVEYEFTVKLFEGRNQVIFTNVRREEDRQVLEKLGAVYEASLPQLINNLGVGKYIVLDPQAKEVLRPGDLSDAELVIIGGIMGDYPPKGRTAELITKKLPNPVPRNLGKEQLTIFGAAYILREISRGRKLEELDIRPGLKATLELAGFTLEVELPYAFPYKGGKPVIPPNYLDVVLKKSQIFEGGGGCG